MIWLERRRPGALQRGATELVGKTTDKRRRRGTGTTAPGAGPTWRALPAPRQPWGRARPGGAARLRSADRAAFDCPPRPTRPGWPRRPAAAAEAGPGRAARLRGPGALREPVLPDRVRPAVRGVAADPDARAGPPVLLVGNEGESYAKVVPPEVEVVLYQRFSLVSQDRSASPRLEVVLRQGRARYGARRVGIAGWNSFDAGRGRLSPPSWIDAPTFIVDTLRALGCAVVNATGAVHRAGLAACGWSRRRPAGRFEFAATTDRRRCALLRRAAQPDRAGRVPLYQPSGCRCSYHPVLLSGERAASGLASASGRVLSRGDPMSASLGYWGSNIARGGFLAASVG